MEKVAASAGHPGGRFTSTAIWNDGLDRSGSLRKAATIPLTPGEAMGYEMREGDFRPRSPKSSTKKSALRGYIAASKQGIYRSSKSKRRPALHASNALAVIPHIAPL